MEYLLSTLPDAPVEKGTFEISDLEDGTAAIQSYKGEESVIEIPAEMDGKKITAIGKGAFEENESVEKVIVPDGVELIQGLHILRRGSIAGKLYRYWCFRF